MFSPPMLILNLVPHRTIVLVRERAFVNICCTPTLKAFENHISVSFGQPLVPKAVVHVLHGGLDRPDLFFGRLPSVGIEIFKFFGHLDLCVTIDAGCESHSAVAIVADDRLLILVSEDLAPDSAVTLLGYRVSETTKTVAGDELRPTESVAHVLMTDDLAEPMLAAFVDITHCSCSTPLTLCLRDSGSDR